jgi:hypothetical protein
VQCAPAYLLWLACIVYTLRDIYEIKAKPQQNHINGESAFSWLGRTAFLLAVLLAARLSVVGESQGCLRNAQAGA